MKRRIISLIAAAAVTAVTVSSVFGLAGCFQSGAKPREPEVILTDNGVEFGWDGVEGATEYKIYHSPSRYAEYSLLKTQTETKFSHTDKYGYYRVEAVGADGVISSENISYDSDTFGPNTYIYAPTDDAELINKDVEKKFEVLEAGQFSSERFGVLFKAGDYDGVRMQTGYYTTVAGLGATPQSVRLGYFNVNAQWFKGNATHNFWRGVENLTVNGDVQWAVSQATSFRRMNVLGGMKLDDGGWSSGGYIANSKISSTINSGGQQQWFTRNSEFKNYQNDGWSRVFIGCKGTTPSGVWPSNRSTVIEKADVMSEKPFLVFDAFGHNGYGVFVNALRENASGVSWDGKEDGDYIPLTDFYVARADLDTADTINAALKEGRHLLFTPGIYRLDKPVVVEKAGTVVMGIGLATLQITDKNTDTLMRVKDVDNVNISGILFDAGTYSETLLQVGERKTSRSHADGRINLSDLYFRVGGAADANTSADVCVEINANDVLIDHFWVWRADHSKGVGWKEGTYTDRNGNTVQRKANRTVNGIVVNGDDVTAYALMVEHFHEYQTLWNGENGVTYFYQSEAPYDAVQEDWTTPEGTLGYASYKVGDNVTAHRAYGVGVYGYANGCVMSNGIEAPAADGVYFEHIFTVMLSGSKPSSVTNVINGVGGEVAVGGQFDRTIEYYYGGQIQSTEK